MRIAPVLEIHTKDPVPVLKKQYQQQASAFNGQISFGNGVSKDNIDGTWVNVVAPVAPNTDFTVSHNLNRIPAGYHVVQKDRAADVYTGSVAATKTQLTLRATVASVVLRIFIFCLVLGFLLAPKSNAQGANHTNIALKNTLVSGSTGIGGGSVVQVIPSAIITVCNGSTLPMAGATCTGTANIFSNVALTNALSNPTNADLNGNYTFYAAAGLSYVVSVGGVGLTTYSYVWSAPVLTAGGSVPNATNLVGPGTISGSYSGTYALVSPTITNPTSTGTDNGAEIQQNKTLTGASNGNSVTLLNAQANAAAITGTGSPVTLYTYTLPANTVANLKGIRITIALNHSTGTASVTYGLTLNGTSLNPGSSNSTGQAAVQYLVLNTGATTGTLSSITNLFANASTATTLTGLAWASSQVLTLTFSVAATDQVTPIQWIVELIQ